MVSFVPSNPASAYSLAKLLVGLEGAVLVGGLAPRDVDGAGDVARALALLLRQMRRREDLARELVGGKAHVDKVS